MARESYVRVRTGAPVSTDIAGIACDLDLLAYEVETGSLGLGAIASRIEWLARRVEKLEGMARAVEARALEVA